MIVPGEASVVKISTSEEILIANSLTEVQEKQLFKEGKHKLVIVTQEEPANSHPVINFSLYGLPCLCLEGVSDTVKEIVKKLDGKNHELVTCVQSSALHLWNKEYASVDDYVSKGFIAHPAKIAHSQKITELLPKDTKVKAEIPQEVKDLLFRVRTATTSKVALEAIETLREHSWLKNLDQKKRKLEERLNDVPLAERKIEPLKGVVEQLQKNVDVAFNHLQALLSQKGEHRLETLFSVKVLETLLFGNEKKGSVGQYSVLSIDSTIGAVEKQITYQEECSSQALFIDQLMFGVASPIPGTFDDWKAFLLNLEKSITIEGKLESILVTDFKKTLNTISRIGALPWFMSIVFPQIKGGNSIERAENIVKLISEDNGKLVDELLGKKESIQTMRQNIDLFADPNTFEKAFEELKKEAEAFHPKPKGSTLQNILQDFKFKEASPLVRYLMIELMNDFVDLYDTSIKTMKSSQSFDSDREKCEKFKAMIAPYLELMHFWSTETVPTDSFSMHQSWPLDIYLWHLKEKFVEMKSDSPENLQPSREFSVSAAVLGSGTLFERHYPKTLEDVFTLAHQNLLATTSLLSNQLLSNEDIERSTLPATLKSAMGAVSKIGGGGVGESQRIGMDVEENRIIVSYNVPLRNHSGRFTLEYSSEKKGFITMDAKFLGEARQRWGFAEETLKLANEVSSLSLATTKVTPQELSYSVGASKDEEIKLMMNVYRAIAIYSLSRNRYNNRLELTKECMKKITHNVVDLLDLFTNELKSNQPYRKIAIVSLLSVIVENEQVHDSVGKLVKQLIADSDALVRADALMLYIKRFEKGYEYEPSEKVVERLIEDENAIVRANALMLYVKLFEKEREYKPAEEVAERLIRDRSLRVRENALLLFNKLFEKGRGYDSAEEVAKELINSRIERLREIALLLFEKLFEKRQGFESAKEAVAEIANHSNRFRTANALIELFKKYNPQGLSEDSEDEDFE
ncbi:MAG: hypothetical protein AAGG81_01275 [Chlamydiota bacterium]